MAVRSYALDVVFKGGERSDSEQSGPRSLRCAARSQYSVKYSVRRQSYELDSSSLSLSRSDRRFSGPPFPVHHLVIVDRKPSRRGREGEEECHRGEEGRREV